MNPIHLHLIAGHTPVIALVSGFLLIQAGTWNSSRPVTRAGLWLVALAGVAAGLVYISGEAAEGISIRLGAPEAMVERHEFWAGWALGAMAAAAAAALAALRRDAGPRLTAVVSALTLLCLFMVTVVSWHGGRIRHPEIQADWKDYRSP
jgi:hypothetical protein